MINRVFEEERRPQRDTGWLSVRDGHQGINGMRVALLMKRRSL
jgi:hypothetical protein